MLNYLDGYPLALPCRYNDRVACYTTVFIISNIDIRLQYAALQKLERESWLAFLRRIHNVKIYSGKRETINSMEQYLNNFLPVSDDTEIPFHKKDN